MTPSRVSTSPLRTLLARERRARAPELALAALCAAAASASAVLLLGLSGWLLTAAAAAAGLAGGLAPSLPSLAIRGLTLVRMAGRYGERLFGHQAALRAVAALRPELFAGIAASPPARALGISTGEASARLVQDVSALETRFVRAASAWGAAAAAVLATGLISLASGLAGAAFLACLGVSVLGLAPLGRRLAQAPGAKMQVETGRIKSALNAYLSAAPELAAFGLQDRAAGAIMGHDADLARAVRARAAVQAQISSLEAGLSALTVVLVLWLSMDAGASLAALAALSAMAGLEAVQGLVRAAQEEGAYDEAVRRLDPLMATSQAPAETADPGAEAYLTILGQRLAPGARVALTGPSGSGKTTLLEGLAGLRDPAGLDLEAAGRRLDAAPVGWARPLISLAPQDAGALSGTIAENLRLADPQASDAQIWEALADAGLKSRVLALPARLDTWIGEGGEILSGGERRRLALARALLRRASWLLLDEPTEGLDAATEREVVAALERRLERTGQGLILVSHRPAPLALCPASIAVPSAPAAQPASA